MLEFRILGPLEVVGQHGSVRLGGPKQRATLGILLLEANRVVSVDRLADDLYAGAAPVTAVTQVQRQISDLRKALGPRSIETRAPGYVIRLAPQQLDLHIFERLTEDASQALARGEAQIAADLLREALALWRGAPLADFAYESFAQTAIERLEEIRLAAVEQRIEADLAVGRHGELAGELEQLIVENPLRERLRAQLMLALYRSGRQAEALDVYQRTRTVLLEEFGIEPTPSLNELQRAILAQNPSLDLARGSPNVANTQRTLLVVPSDDGSVEQLLTVCEPLGKLAARELIIARLVSDEGELE
jgi:DNA-binding SARP family transcriptional activator